MRTGLQPVDLDDLVERPLLGVLATRRSNGDVLLSPLWHEWRDGGVQQLARRHMPSVRCLMAALVGPVENP